MAGIWQNIEITWQGEAYNVRPDMDLINEIESKHGASLTGLLVRLQNKDLPSSLACHVIACVLRKAGLQVDANTVYAETGGIGAEAITIVQTILIACLPMPKDAKPAKPAARVAAPAKTRRKQIGASSTE